jgi:asparagine synthase (glutamine-hydrolysing)
VSAVLGVFGPADARPPAALARPMLARMARRGAGAVDVHRAPGALLAVARHGWETAPHLGGPAEVAADGAVRVAADAALYHRGDLLRALAARGVRPAGESAAELILGAYRAWGVSCPRWLEGDFAFVLWDGAARRVLCARDFAGKRPLVYAAPGDTLVADSTAGGVLAHPAVPAELDPVSIAETAAGLWAGGDATAFRAVRTLLAGHTLVWCDGRVRIDRHWTPPRLGSAAGPPFEQAAEELRERLVAAAAERLPAAGAAAVWMSGGWDSTAVFAAGQVARQRGTPAPLEIVSMSHPPGDPGREDETILRVARRWNRPVRWLHIGGVSLFAGAAARAAERDEPFAHVFEAWNRALIARGRELGARVALDGNGGDQLFFTSNVVLADLLREGRWMALWREWKAKGGADPRDLFACAVQPLLAPWMVDALGWIRRRPLRPTFERPLPAWIDPGFARRNGLRARERAHNPRPRRRAGPAEREAYWYLAAPYFPRAYGLVSGFALEMGIELRSPLLDRRVVEFAAARPRDERNAGRETKRLLRAAMRGLLPDEVLAPRDVKTGTLGGYFAAGMRAEFPALAAQAFRAPLLAELGIADPAALCAACAEYARTADGSLGFALAQTLHVELWLRARDRPAESAEPPATPAPEAALAGAN